MIKKPRLVIATDNYLPRWDGISRFLSEITPRLRDEFKLTIIAPDFGKTPKEDFKLIKIPTLEKEINAFKPAKLQYKKIKEAVKEADIVFTQTIGPIGFLAIKAAKKYSKPLVTFIHSIEWELFSKSMNNNFMKKIVKAITKKLVVYIYNKADLLITPADNTSDLLSWQKVQTKKEIIHLGVNINKFRKKDKEQAKQKIGLGKNSFVIGYHGRLGFEKDLKTLMRAFVRIRTNYPNAYLLIVGEGVAKVEKIFKDQERVIMPGVKDDVVPWINAMDIYVLTSLTETSSLSTLEAMACEVPVIATKVGFVKDYLQEGKNGLFFKKSDSYELSNKIELLMNDSKLRKTLGEQARATVIEKFRWKLTSEKIANTIKEVLNK